MKFKPVRLEQAKKLSLDKGEMADEENEASKNRFHQQCWKVLFSGKKQMENYT